MAKNFRRISSLLFVFVFTSYSAVSQRLLPDTASGFIGTAYTTYITAVQEEIELFNGREYIGYLNRFSQGSPYFLKGNFSKGEITYLNRTYTDFHTFNVLVPGDSINRRRLFY